MLIAWVFNTLALVFGVLLGARALFEPKWASRLVRLREDEQGGGFAEFRATYGGVFLGLHAVTLFMSLKYLMGGEFVLGVAAAGGCAALSAGWADAAFGRAIAIVRDKADTQFNRFSVVFELVMAAALGGPWAVWALGL